MTIYFTYIIPTLCVLSAIVASICIVFFIAAYCKNKLQINRRSFCGSAVFFIVILLNYIGYTFMSLNSCHSSIYNISSPICLILNILKAILLVSILFTTVDGVYKGTPFALSKCTIIAFRILLVLSCILLVCGASMFPLGRRTLGFAIAGTSQSLLDILSIYLVCVFVRKLLQTYSGMDSVANQDNQAKPLVSIITKIALLFAISTCTRIAVTVIYASSVKVLSAHYSLLGLVMVVVDLHANFFCIFLCFKHFDAVYMKLCGICDKCCRRCWMRCFVKTVDEEMMEKELQIVRVQSKSVTKTSPNLSTSPSERSTAESYAVTKSDQDVSSAPKTTLAATTSASEVSVRETTVADGEHEKSMMDTAEVSIAQ